MQAPRPAIRRCVRRSLPRSRGTVSAVVKLGLFLRKNGGAGRRSARPDMDRVESSLQAGPTRTDDHVDGRHRGRAQHADLAVQHEWILFACVAGWIACVRLAWHRRHTEAVTD